MTEFQRKVWEWLCKQPMPFGYKKILVSDWFPISDESKLPEIQDMENLNNKEGVQVWDMWVRRYKIFN
jgi:hypothetical protein